jgi:geranylgeranyl diphosphate synthase type II
MTSKKSDYSDLWAYLEDHREAIERELRSRVPSAPPEVGTLFNQAAEYVLFSGGKRLRPILTLLGCELVGGRSRSVLPAAVASEFIHTSSLIFDDLPCMDNATERRGVAAVHERFGEGLAVLVGLAFLSDAYGLISNCNDSSPQAQAMAIREMVECIGPHGMIGGQAVDLAMAGSDGSVRASEEVRNLKTSALMRLTLVVGAILGGGKSEQLESLRRFSISLGEAYQLSDDLLDLAEDSKIFSGVNRPLGLQEGVEGLREALESKVSEAKAGLVDGFPESTARTCLLQLADYLCGRES